MMMNDAPEPTRPTAGPDGVEVKHTLSTSPPGNEVPSAIGQESPLPKREEAGEAGARDSSLVSTSKDNFDTETAVASADENNNGSTRGAASSGPGGALAPGRWRAMIAMIAVLVFLNGYDVSNTANIQASIYQAFGHIEIFSWITLGYCVGIAGTLPLFRGLAQVFDFRDLFLASTIIFMVGSAIAASAIALPMLIVGRAICGVGAGGATYFCVGYVAFFSKPAEVARVQAMIGMMLSIGLIAGPLIGTGFADDSHATWRWAYYLVIPIVGALLVPIWLAFPSYTIPKQDALSRWQRLGQVDWTGATLHIGTTLTLALALTLSGSEYSWDSGSAIALWVVAGLCLCSYVLQQRFSVFTTPQRRIFPGHLLKNHTVASANLGSFCAAVGYSVGLYYLPVFYALVRGHGPVESAVRFLPFIGAFIAGVVISGGLLPVIGRYKIMYVIGESIMLIAAALITSQLRPSVSEGTVMGLETLLGFGVGSVFNYATPISAAVLPPQELLAAVCLSNLANLGMICVGLSIAGAVFQNVGFHLLSDALSSYEFSDHEIRLALGGAASRIWSHSDPGVQEAALSALCWTINTVFWLIVAAGAVGTIAALLMSREKLDFHGRKKGTDQGVSWKHSEAGDHSGLAVNNGCLDNSTST